MAQLNNQQVLDLVEVFLNNQLFLQQMGAAMPPIYRNRPVTPRIREDMRDIVMTDQLFIQRVQEYAEQLPSVIQQGGVQTDADDVRETAWAIAGDRRFHAHVPDRTRQQGQGAQGAGGGGNPPQGNQGQGAAAQPRQPQGTGAQGAGQPIVIGQPGQPGQPGSAGSSSGGGSVGNISVNVTVPPTPQPVAQPGAGNASAAPQGNQPQGAAAAAQQTPLPMGVANLQAQLPPLPPLTWGNQQPVGAPPAAQPQQPQHQVAIAGNAAIVDQLLYLAALAPLAPIQLNPPPAAPAVQPQQPPAGQPQPAPAANQPAVGGGYLIWNGAAYVPASPPGQVQQGNQQQGQGGNQQQPGQLPAPPMGHAFQQVALPAPPALAWQHSAGWKIAALIVAGLLLVLLTGLLAKAIWGGPTVPTPIVTTVAPPVAPTPIPAVPAMLPSCNYELSSCIARNAGLTPPVAPARVTATCDSYIRGLAASGGCIP